MVAKVISGKNIRGVLQYNENKVNEDLATCIHASGFGVPAANLSFSSKLLRFEKLLQLNPKVRTNTLHISLNFDPSEQLLLNKLVQISSEYMTRIGFGNQPFLVYKHHDAGHPHVHIITTNITSSGKRIDIHNIGRNQSDKARKEVENIFNLVKADSKKVQYTQLLKPIDLQKATYGKSETKRSITNIVRTVAKSYRFTSLPEFNAVLRQYNVIADRGSESSAMFQKGGLIYSIVNAEGQKVGVPIKASSVYDKPTLKFLESQYKLNELLRLPFRENLKSKIAEQLNLAYSAQDLIRRLKDKNAAVILRQNKDGIVYGLTYIDHNSRTVFNGSDLGKEYTAKRVFEKFNSSSRPETTAPVFKESGSPASFELQNPLEDLVTAQQFDFSSPKARRKRRRKKYRKLN